MKKTDFTKSWRFGRTGEQLKAVSVPHDAMLLEQRKQENASGSGSAYFGSGCYEIHTGTEPHFVFLAQKIQGLFVQLFKKPIAEIGLLGFSIGFLRYFCAEKL